MLPGMGLRARYWYVIFRFLRCGPVAPCVCIFDAEQVRVFPPIWSLFLERDSAETDLHPVSSTAIRDARVLHVPEILVARH